MKEILNKLEKLGFTNYESKVFLVLMKGHNMTAAEVAKEANIPRTSVYDILKLFTEKGLCNEIETPSKLRFEMIDPDVVEAKLRNDFKRAHNTKLDELSASFSKLKSLYKVKAPPERKVKIELLRGFNKYRELKFLNLLNESKKEILITNRLEGGRVLAEQSKDVIDFLNGGGILKTLYEINTNFKIKVNKKWVDADMSGLVSLCETFEKHGVKIRLLRNVPQNFTVFDSKIVFINLIDETMVKYNKSDMIVRNEKYAQSMRDLFNHYWDSSMTVQEFKKNL